jgi:glycosyltransferase involved in cell wall biosynthesis
MKILIVSQYFHPERFVISGLAEELALAGHTVIVLTGMPNYPGGRLFPGYRRPWPKREVYGAVEIIRVPLIPRGNATGLRLVLNYLSFMVSTCMFSPFLLLRESFDVILVFEPSPVTVGVPARVVKWLKRTPLVFWIQDLWPDTLEAVGAVKNRWMLGAVRRLVRWIYRGCDMILVQSKAFVPRVRELAPPRTPIRFLPNPAERIYHPLTPAPGAVERDLMRPGFRIVFAGNMGAAQDLGTVLAAAERLRHRPDIQWILIGGGRARPWVEEQIAARGLDANVQLLGPFPVERMPDFFALADALLLTLRKDDIFALTIPSRLQAYLACGRPVVAAIEGEGARIVKEAGAGLVCTPGDAPELAAAVEALRDSPQARRIALGEAGRRYFEKEFDRDLLVKRLESCLQEAIGNGR